MKKYFKIAIIGLMVSVEAYAQAQIDKNNQHQLLVGLTKANTEKYYALAEKIMFSKKQAKGSDQVVYLHNGSKISKNNAAKLIDSKGIIYDVYIDQHKKIKVMVL